MKKSHSVPKMFSRNLGFFSIDEQHALAQSTVAIAGAGGDGFQLAYKLAMMGVGSIRIADPETFETENANRVFAATNDAIGKNKAAIFKERVSALPVKPKVTVFEEGVTEKNIASFIKGADLIIDESELTYLHIGTMIAREARKNGVPVLMVMNIGFAGVATSFRPSGGRTFEQMMGIPKDASLDDVSEMTLNLGTFLPYLPYYGDLATLRAVQDGAPLPSITQGVDIASAIGTTEAFLHLTAHVRNHRKKPVWAPKFRYMDAYTNKSKIIASPRLSYLASVIKMTIRDLLGMNPKADYGTKSSK